MAKREHRPTAHRGRSQTADGFIRGSRAAKYERPSVADQRRRQIAEQLRKSRPVPVFARPSEVKIVYVTHAAPSRPGQQAADHQPAKRSWFMRFGIPISAVVLLLAGGSLAIMSFMANQQVFEQVQAYDSEVSDSGIVDNSDGSSQQGSRGTSGTDGDAADYQDARAPVKLEVPNIGINASSLKVGLNSKGNIGAPPSIRNVAWYINSSSPVDTIGSAIIVGHTGTERNPGVFSKLHTLESGNEIKVHMADGSVYNYEVASIENKLAEGLDMAPYLSYKESDRRIVHLITCYGNYNASTYSYDYRIIVTAYEKL